MLVILYSSTAVAQSNGYSNKCSMTCSQMDLSKPSGSIPKVSIMSPSSSCKTPSGDSHGGHIDFGDDSSRSMCWPVVSVPITINQSITKELIYSDISHPKNPITLMSGLVSWWSGGWFYQNSDVAPAIPVIWMCPSPCLHWLHICSSWTHHAWK